MVFQSKTLSTCLLVLLGTSISFGQLLVSDRATGQISQFDAQTGAFQRVLVAGDLQANGGLIAPSSMTLGPDGELLVASFAGLNPEGTGSVLRYDASSGEFLGAFAEGLLGPSGLHYSEERDELYVSTLGNFDSETVFRYQASTGELLSSFGEGTGMSGRTTIDFGPDGNLYVASFANGEFFTGAILQFDGETQAPLGSFAVEPFLAGANNFTFRDGQDENTYQLDLVGLFSNNVARFNVVADDMGSLSVSEQGVLIAEGLDFPSALIDLDNDTMLISNLGNDNPQMGELRPGSIGRFDVATGEFVDTFIGAGGDANLSQPTALLLLSSQFDACAAGLEQRDQQLNDANLILGDFNANGEVDFPDFLTLSQNFGAEGGYAEGDANCNGDIEFNDFLALSQNFGQTSASEAHAVPEPSGFWLMAIVLVLPFTFRSKRV